MFTRDVLGYVWYTTGDAVPEYFGIHNVLAINPLLRCDGCLISSKTRLLSIKGIPRTTGLQ